MDTRHEGQRLSYTQRHFPKSDRPAVTIQIPDKEPCTILKGSFRRVLS